MRFESIKEKARELKDALDRNDEQRIRNAVEKMVRNVEIRYNNAKIAREIMGIGRADIFHEK